MKLRKPLNKLLLLISVFCLNMGADAQFRYVNTNPFDNQYFIENNGQWNFNNADFALWTGMDNVFIQKGGAGFIWDVYLVEEKDLDKKDKIEEHDENVNFSHESVQFQLVNTLPNARFSIEKKSRHYWTFGAKEFNSFGYKKITYHNIYPQIDVVYEIGNKKDGQIKYSFILHPGANIQDIKIQWVGAKSTEFLNQLQAVSVRTQISQFLDSGLNAHTVNQENWPIKYVKRGDFWGFESEKLIDKVAVIIDPYVKRIDSLNIIIDPQRKQWSDFSNMIIMSDYDRDNQNYLMSACLRYPQIAQYNLQGEINWIFSGFIASINWYSSMRNSSTPAPGAILLDRIKKKIFIGKGWELEGDILVRLDSLGNWDNYLIQLMRGTEGEIWNMDFNCLNNSIVIGGGAWGIGLPPNGFKMKNLWTIDPKSDSSQVLEFSNTLDSLSKRQDVVGAVTDNENNYFSILNYDKLIYKLDSNNNPYLDSRIPQIRCIKSNKNLIGNVWNTNVMGLLDFIELENYPNLSKSQFLTNRNNCIAVNNEYLYLYDGKVMLALDKSNGNILCADSIFYHSGLRGHIGQSGIAVDECNHVFLGGDSTNLLVFTFDGKKFNYDTAYQFIKNSDRACIDVRLNRESGTLFISGDSFTAAMQNPFQCFAPSFNIDTTYIPRCQGDYVGTVKKGDTSTNYTFRWSIRNHGSDSVIRLINRKIGASDTLKNPSPKDTIELLVAINYECNGEYQKTVFIPNLHDTSWVKDTFCAGDSLILRGRAFYKDTSFIDRLTNIKYCDSWVKYQLIFHPVDFDSIHYNVCRGDTLSFGNLKITETGVYLDTLQKINGCDSIVLRDVLFWGSSHFQKVHICSSDTLRVGPLSHTLSGFYKDNLPGYLGCDSVIHTELHVHSDTSYQIEYSPCFGDTLSFSGKNIVEDGIYTDSLKSIWGCDSVIMRKVDFKNPIRSYSKVYLCKNTTYTYSGVKYNAPGNVYDTLTAWDGCDSSIHIQLIPTSLSVNFDVDSSKSPEITYTNQSNSQVKFIWHFGDGNKDSTEENPTHRYSNKEDREIEVCLVVRDSFGCVDTLCRKVNIYKLGYWIYNAFSPNQDGSNDVHRIGYRGEPFIYTIYIYNRWGALVYKSEKSQIDDASKFWNGRVMNTGEECPSGSYFVIYEFFTEGISIQPTIVEGVVELFR